MIRSHVRRFCALAMTCCFLSTPVLARSHDSYRSCIKNWSRSEESYRKQDFFATVSWAAVYLSPEYLVCREKEVAKTYDLSATESAKELAAQQELYAGKVTFFVSFYTYDHKADLADSKTDWRLRLVLNGEEVAPSQIKAVRAPTELERKLFPGIQPWSRSYYISFPIAAQSGESLTLKVNGPAGRSELNF